MGAVTALYYMNYITNIERKRILGIVLDSPFSDLEKLTIDFCKKKYDIPNFLSEIVFSFINMGIKDKINLNLKMVKLLFSLINFFS